MPKQQLREMLEELHHELEHTRSGDVDETSRELLRGVLEDARGLVDEDGGGSRESESMLEQLRETARDFEESHPTLAAAVGRVATALSNLGI